MDWSANLLKGLPTLEFSESLFFNSILFPTSHTLPISALSSSLASLYPIFGDHLNTKFDRFENH